MIHPLDRPYQMDTYRKIIESDKQIIIIESPTGSGKTAWAGQLVEDGNKVLSLVNSKAIQSENYTKYGFYTLFGRQNYCTCARCNGSGHDKCLYAPVKKEALNEAGLSLNYAKFISDSKLVEHYDPAYLFLDEAHLISDAITNYAGIELDVNLVSASFDLLPNKRLPIPLVANWLDSITTSDKTTKHKVKMAQKYLDNSWFAYLEDNILTCKPLYSQRLFKQLFYKAPRIVLVSATIGNIETFTRELGIEDYDYFRVPNIFPPQMRQVITPHNAPKISYNKPQFDDHIKAIRALLQRFPKHWTGIIHCTSKNLAMTLSEALRGNCVWTPSGKSTQDELQDWLEFRKRPGAIGICWQFWEGVDLASDNYVIVAKTPFPHFGSPYEVAKFEANKRAALQKAANRLIQACGRVRRGELSHYGNNKAVAIADGNWEQLKHWLNGFEKCITVI